MIRFESFKLKLNEKFDENCIKNNLNELHFPYRRLTHAVSISVVVVAFALQIPMAKKATRVVARSERVANIVSKVRDPIHRAIPSLVFILHFSLITYYTLSAFHLRIKLWKKKIMKNLTQNCQLLFFGDGYQKNFQHFSLTVSVSFHKLFSENACSLWDTCVCRSLV